MSHQPYEKWLLTNVSLEQSQQQSLEAHLTECDKCHQLTDALTQIDELFTNTAEPNITPGFTQRWHQRLLIERQYRQQRNLWLFTFGLFFTAGIIILVLILGNFSTINLSYELSRFIASTSLLAARITKVWNIVSSLVRTLPFLIPIIIVAGLTLFSALSGLVIAWFSIMIKIFRPTQKGVSA